MDKNRRGKKVNYRLYILSDAPLPGEKIVLALGYCYSRITSDYILIYTDKGKPEGAVLLRESELSGLSAEDLTWLLNANLSIAADFAEKHRLSVEKGQETFLSEFSRELSLERQRSDSRPEEKGKAEGVTALA
ncbi:MAG: hypothetical protein RR394_08585 [Oscillospiraceae bacterium]